MKFYKLAIGAHFKHCGRLFTKSAMSMAVDERGWGHLVLGVVEVEPEGEALLLSPEEAAKWKPDYGPWTEMVEREFALATSTEHGAWRCEPHGPSGSMERGAESGGAGFGGQKAEVGGQRRAAEPVTREKGEN